MKNLKELLDFHANLKNCDENLFNTPDPLQVAKVQNNDVIALICALFAYGNAGLIVKFLKKLDFDLLKKSDEEIKNAMNALKYRFENSRDTAEIFITLKRFSQNFSIEEEILKGMQNSAQIIDGINNLIKTIYLLNDYRSQGYEFFFGHTFEDEPKSPYKRYNMFLRWMVRDSDIDLGLFSKIDKKDLLIPLDVHTHRVCLALGLCKRKSYDFKSVMQITQNLREFDANDPIKYDFALYRLGQSGEIGEILKNSK